MIDLEAIIKYSHAHKARITVEFDNGVVYIYENGKVIRGASAMRKEFCRSKKK